MKVSDIVASWQNVLLIMSDGKTAYNINVLGKTCSHFDGLDFFTIWSGLKISCQPFFGSNNFIISYPYFVFDIGFPTQTLFPGTFNRLSLSK